LKDYVHKIEDDMDKKYGLIQKADDLFTKLKNVFEDELPKVIDQLAEVNDIIEALEDQLKSETDSDDAK